MTALDAILADAPWGVWDLHENVGSGLQNLGSATEPVFAGVVKRQQPPVLADGGYSMSTDTGSISIASYTEPGGAGVGLLGANVTYAAWVNVPAGNYKGSIWQSGGGTGRGWGVGIGDTSVDTVGRNVILLNDQVAWLPTTTPFAVGKNHLAVVRSGATFEIYLNGVLVATKTATNMTADNTVMLGSSPGSSGRTLPTAITVDEASAFSASLTAARIAAHYNGGAGDRAAVLADSPVLLLPLDDAASATTFADGSGNGRTLSPYSGSLPNQEPGPGAYKATRWTKGVAGGMATTVTVVEPATVTYECWLYLRALPASRQGVMAFGGSGGSGITSGMHVDTDGTIYFTVYPGGNIKGVTPLSLNTWHHVVCSVGAAGAKVRLDGVTDVTSATVSVAQAASGRFHLRDLGPVTSPQANGISLGLPAVWYGQQLSDAQTDAHFAAMTAAAASENWWDGAAIQPANLKGWWDGAVIQPANLKGWYDGAAIQAVK